MSKLPLPDRGQPIDVSYIYQIVGAINDVSESVSNATNNYATIKTKEIGSAQSFKISNIRIYAGYTDVAVAETVSQTRVIPVTVDMGVTFAYPPVVIASVVNNNTQAAGNDATVVISSTTTTSVSFRVRFSTAGEVSVGVNFIAIGVPA